MKTFKGEEAIKVLADNMRKSNKTDSEISIAIDNFRRLPKEKQNIVKL